MTLIQEVSESGAVPDAYTRLVDVVGMNAVARMEMVEGFLTFQTFGCTVYYGLTKPSAAQAGSQWLAGSGFGLGPRQTKGTGWRLDRIWLKNTTAGSASTAVLQGIVETL